MGQKAPNYPPENAIKPPPPPASPLSRMLREGGTCGICPKCGSSLKRTKIFFGKKKCIHPECGWAK